MRRSHDCFKQEGWQVGVRIVQRLRRELGVGGAGEKAQAQATGGIYGPSDPGQAPSACVDVEFCS